MHFGGIEYLLRITRRDRGRGSRVYKLLEMELGPSCRYGGEYVRWTGQDDQGEIRFSVTRQEEAMEAELVTVEIMKGSPTIAIYVGRMHCKNECL